MTRKKYSGSRLVYSTNPDTKTGEPDSVAVPTTAHPSSQTLYVQLDKRHRKGKSVTLVVGFAGSSADLNDLGKRLRSTCGVGGTVKDGQILIQGDFRDRIKQILTEQGFKVKRVGG